MNFGGQDAVGLPEPPTAGDSVLADLNKRALTTMFAVSVNNDRLMRRFHPGPFDSARPLRGGLPLVRLTPEL